MKLGTIDHPKMLLLAHRLGIDQSAAVGIIQCLHDFTAAYARTGNVGRWTDSQIRLGCKTSISETVLIPVLIECGWIDRHPVHRLVVHDWHEHAEKYIKDYLDRNHLAFANIPLDPEGESQSQGAGDPMSRSAATQAAGRSAGDGADDSCQGAGDLSLTRSREAAKVENSPENPVREHVRTCPEKVAPTNALANAKESPPGRRNVLPVPVGDVSANGIVEGFWKAMGEERTAQPSELARAGELIERYGSELLRELVPKVAAKIKAEKRPIRLLGGAMRDFELAAAQVSRREAEARRRGQEAEERRRASLRGEEQKAEMQRMRDRNRKRWDAMTEAERGQIRADVVAKWPILADSPDLLMDACLLQLCQLPEEPCLKKTRSRSLSRRTSVRRFNLTVR